MNELRRAERKKEELEQMIHEIADYILPRGPWSNDAWTEYEMLIDYLNKHVGEFPKYEEKKGD